MDFKTCRFCRKNFRGFAALCPECVDKLDEKYLIVRNYLDGHSESNLKKVTEEAGVDEKSLLYLIREGRLMLKGGAASVACLKCGGPILSGKYCDKCKADLMRNLENTKSAMTTAGQPARPKPKAAEQVRGRMHVLKDE